MQSIEKEQMIPFEVSFREVFVKRKIEAQTKIATLSLPLLNKPQSMPKFARVSELWVCDGGQTQERHRKANVSFF